MEDEDLEVGDIKHVQFSHSNISIQKFRYIAGLAHRSLTQHLRHVIDEEIRRFEEEQKHRHHVDR